MQSIIVEKPYRFVPPVRSTRWSALCRLLRMQFWIPRWTEGVVAQEFRGVERLRESLQSRHGILLAPNHCRYCDPFIVASAACTIPCYIYTMASWHTFHGSRLAGWGLPRIGTFSVNREGVDRQAINLSVEILDTAERPLLIFPEGGMRRANDRLQPLMEGIAAIAHAAARRRAKRIEGGTVVIHPVAIKFLFQGHLESTVEPVLCDLESGLFDSRPAPCPLIERIYRLATALLESQEAKYLGAVRSGPFAERQDRLVAHIVEPLEREWLPGPASGAAVPRIRALRQRIVPELVQGRLDEAERERRWRQLTDLYVAQQIASYPSDYLSSRLSVDRLLETVEHFEEDVTDRSRLRGPLKAIVEIGEAITVSPSRSRREHQSALLESLATRLQGMLDRLALESPLYS